MKVYHIKKLIDGYKVKPEFRNKTLVCCKSSKGYTHIIYDNRVMKLEEPLTTLAFQDNFGRGTYFLDYYEWKPKEVTVGALW